MLRAFGLFFLGINGAIGVPCLYFLLRWQRNSRTLPASFERWARPLSLGAAGAAAICLGLDWQL